MADRNPNQLIQRLQSDPRVDDTVIAATALMRISIFMMMGSGVIGLILVQVLFGEGLGQFLAGMLAGYALYFLYVKRTMGEPNVVGVMAVLTDKNLLLLGSRKAGVVAKWKLNEIESLELVRKGNLFTMGKLALTPVGSTPIGFFTSNRTQGRKFVESFQEMGSSGR